MTEYQRPAKGTYLEVMKSAHHCMEEAMDEITLICIMCIMAAEAYLFIWFMF